MKDSRTPRLLVLAGFLAAVLLLYLGVLYNTQVLQHEDYLARSLHSIAKEETIDASRGIITDRKGRTLVSNDSVYDLTFDTSLLKADQDQNEAILRLLELCREEGLTWTDNLPISTSAPYLYRLDAMSSAQRSRFLTYVKSLKKASSLLGAYLLEHPELTETPEEDDGAASQDSSSSESTLSPEAQGKALLEQLPAESFTSQLLNDAGLTPQVLMDLMAEELKLPSHFSRKDTRSVLGIRYELALRRMNGYTSLVLVEGIDIELISVITDGNYAGAKISNSSVRKYATSYAAHILGTVGAIDSREELAKLGEGYTLADTVGKSGVESAFEQYLKGTDGKRVVSTNSEGKITGEYYEVEPKPGATVELTIDLELQQVVEDALAETVTNMNLEDGRDDRGAAAVVEKVGTGEILALASYPTYDLSTYRRSEVYAELSADPAKPFQNRATSYPYAPGSTLKPLTAVAALESGATTLTEKIRDTGWWSYPNDPTGSGTWCWFRSGHGLLNVTQAITNSCNYFFAEMGYRMGMDTLREYLTAFGLGEHTGIEIGDNAGTLPENETGRNYAPWAAYGQANQEYTPAQLANYIATLVSGGKHCQAHLLKAVKTYDNSDVLAVGSTTPDRTVEIHDSTLEAVKKGMLGYTQPGGMVYSYFKDCVVTAGAKTGTAQLGGKQTNNGVFVCFAPYEEPEIVVSIVIEKGGAGSALASTAVKILNAYFTADEIGTAILPENQLLP